MSQVDHLCIDCGSPFSFDQGIRGRPRKRCQECSPPRPGLQGSYVPRPKTASSCGECGASFTGISGRQFCSAQCRINVGNARQRDRLVAEHGIVSFRCAFCDAPVLKVYGDQRSRYCSFACKRKHGWKLGVGTTHRRRAKKAGVEYEPFDKRLVFERDGWKCQICGTATPEAKCGTGDDNEPVLDHVVSFTRAGAAHTLENVQCACRGCNAEKHAGPPAGQIGLFTGLLNEQIRSRRRRSTHPTPTKPA